MEKQNKLLRFLFDLIENKFGIFVFFSSLLLSTNLLAQTSTQKIQIVQQSNVEKLHQLHSEFSEKALLNKQKLAQITRLKGIQTKIQRKDGSISEAQGLTENGEILYYTTFNVAAARSTRTNHINSGGSLGLNLDGQNMTAHVWDGGHARITHQEYDGPGGNDRVSIQDIESEGGIQLNFHAAHVTGTIMASGVNANAKGMASQAKVNGYMWNNDVAEAAEAAANGMLVSNHSYGFNGNFVPDQYFGAYIEQSRNWDEIMFNAPFYLMVVAAGNDGNQNDINEEPLDGNASYDKLTGHSTSKNNLVVANANDAIIDDTNGNLTSVSINSSSSQGPTDDYRIKPDITGNGTDVFSTYEGSDTQYNSITGTSMASPNVTGSLLLLQQHYNNINGYLMKAATLKGLALHTADDAGPSGPDIVYGWGLLNAKAAAETITSVLSGDSKVEELQLESGQSYTIDVESDGVNPLLASISWTDRPGVAVTATNSNTPVLVNDLDIRVSKGATTYSPYKLTSITTNSTGDNVVDPFERVDVANASGSYTITVTHKGSLTGNSQNFSLIVTGISGTPVVCSATVPTGVVSSNIKSDSALISWNGVPAATYDIRYRNAGTSDWTTEAIRGANFNLTGLLELTAYEVQVRSKCEDETNSDYSTTITFTTPEFKLEYCNSNGKNLAGEYIGRVQLGTIDNTSNTTGYSDFTELSTNLFKDNSNTIVVTPVWQGGTYDEGYSVWIDYNQDGDFEDTGEQVWTKAPSQSTSAEGSFIVPIDAKNGITRMRVSMKYLDIPTACESFEYGEVEDYSVTIGQDSEAPSTPTELIATDINDTSLTLSWTAATDNFGVKEYDVIQEGSVIATVTSTTTTITDLTKNTTYQFNVIARDEFGNESVTSNTLEITTTGADDSATCTSTINSFPYNQGFENTIGKWTQSNTDDLDWIINKGKTPTDGTGPSMAAQEMYYIFVEASGNGTAYSNKQAILTSPCFDLTNLLQASFNFDYHMFGSNDIGSIAVEISTDEGISWTSIWNQTDNQGDSWKTVNIDLVNYIGSFVKLRFNRITGASSQADIAIDNISVTKETFTADTNPNGPPVFKTAVAFPNPTNGKNLFIAMPKSGQHTYAIYNLIGTMIRKGTFTDKIDVSSFDSGMYMIIIDKKTNIKFIKE